MDIIIRIRKNSTTMTPTTRKGALAIEDFLVSSACGEAYHIKTPKLNKPISLTGYEWVNELVEAEFKEHVKVKIIGEMPKKQTALCTLENGVWTPVNQFS